MRRSWLTTLALHCVFAFHPENNACTNIAAYHVAAISRSCSYNPDVLSDFKSIIERHGYDMTQHSVTTNDGYILNLFRISSPNVTVSKYPILLLHGIAINAESWISTGDQSLGFNVVQKGYDVWVGTIRGTKNANNHTTLTVKDTQFWNYNLDTIAEEDLSPQLALIFNATQQKVLIITHSMGTTLTFMFSSEYPENATKLIKGVVALAPVAYLNDVFLLDLVRPLVLFILDVLNAFSIKGILYREDLVHRIFNVVCKNIPEFCYTLLSTIPGKTVQFPPEHLLLFLSYWSSGTSIFQLKHFLQISKSGKFQKYDYGTKENVRIYGSTAPPIYNLSRIQVPVCLFYGKHDILYRKQNVNRLYNEIGSKVKFQTPVPVNQKARYDFGHLDFLDSRNVKEFLYEALFDRIKKSFG